MRNLKICKGAPVHYSQHWSIFIFTTSVKTDHEGEKKNHTYIKKKFK